MPIYQIITVVFIIRIYVANLSLWLTGVPLLASIVNYQDREALIHVALGETFKTRLAGDFGSVFIVTLEAMNLSFVCFAVHSLVMSPY